MKGRVWLGLCWALGGAGLRAEDLAVLYAALANDGLAQPLVWQENAAPQSSYRMMQTQSAQKITDILRQAPTPDGRVPHWLTGGSQALAYKTGTSYGFRDAWAAGYTDDYTIIVWAGRPDGAPRTGLTGRGAAAPLLFDIAALLPGEDGETYHRIKDAPQGLQSFGGARDEAPQLLFPPQGAEIALSEFGKQARGLTLAARTQTGRALFWYVGGQPIAANTLNGQTVWRPETPGFYEITVTDSAGKSTKSDVRVLALN